MGGTVRPTGKRFKYEIIFRRYDGAMRYPEDVCGPNADGINGRLALIVFRAGVEVEVRGEARLQAELGIDGRDYTTLAVLADDRPASQQDLARLMGKTPPLMVAAVDALEAKGLVERRRAERDRRRSVVELTDEGRAMLAKADAVAQAVVDELFGGLTAEEREELHDTLRRAMAVDEVAAPA
jgi:DNA-binding MarR family transcriptional regulator